MPTRCCVRALRRDVRVEAEGVAWVIALFDRAQSHPPYVSRHSVSDLEAIEATLNARPRKTLRWQTPAETFNQLASVSQAGVASTP